jgi:transcriptional regulator with XRE-family HTH domain
MLEPKETYNIEELFENLPISIRELAKLSGINEVTLARIRDGRPAHRSTANKLLNTFATIYDRPFYLRKVEGINVPINKRMELQEKKISKEPAVA